MVCIHMNNIFSLGIVCQMTQGAGSIQIFVKIPQMTTVKLNSVYLQLCTFHLGVLALGLDIVWTRNLCASRLPFKL